MSDTKLTAAQQDARLMAATGALHQENDALEKCQDDLERRLTEAQERIAAIERRFGVGKSRSDGESGKEMDG